MKTFLSLPARPFRVGHVCCSAQWGMQALYVMLLDTCNLFWITLAMTLISNLLGFKIFSCLSINCMKSTMLKHDSGDYHGRSIQHEPCPTYLLDKYRPSDGSNNASNYETTLRETWSAFFHQQHYKTDTRCSCSRDSAQD